MRKLKAFAFVAVAGVLLAGALQAQSPNAVGFDGFLTSSHIPGHFNSTTVGYGFTESVVPYTGRMWITDPTPAHISLALLPPAGLNAFGPVTDIYCVDYWNGLSPSAVYYTNLGVGAADVGTYTRTHISNTAANNAIQLANYLKSAYLIQTYLPGADLFHQASVSAAIWQIMSGAPTLYTLNGASWDGTLIGAYLADANVNYGKVRASDWVVVTGKHANGKSGWETSTGGEQEFIVNVTPEPATLLLLGTGLASMLVAMGALRRPTA